MHSNRSVEDLIRQAQALDREGCKSALRRFRRPRLDFTEEYLDRQTLEQLRHIVLAAWLRAARADRRVG